MENSTPEERTHLFSVQFSTGLVAAMLGNLVGGKMPEWFAGLAPGLSQLVYFRWTLLAGACLSFFGLIPLLAVREPPARVPQQRGRLAPFRNREEFGAVGGFLLNSALIGMGAGLVVPFFNLYFAKRFECSSAQIGFFFSGAQVTMAVAVLAAPFLARRWGKVQAIVFTEAASLPFLLSLSVERYLPFAVAAFWLRSAFMNMGGPISSSFMMELVPEDRRATASSLVGMSWNLTWAFSASASGWIMQRYGYSIPFFITAFLYALAAVTFFVMFREREAQQGRQGKG
jgi:predicted MFS family arabinose efflux permease